MGKVLSLTLLLLLLAACGGGTVALAQGTDDYNQYEFYVGYSHNRVDTNVREDNNTDFDDLFDERTGFHGLNASATGNVNRYIGLKFEFSAYFKDRTFNFGGRSFNRDSQVYEFLGGVQIKDNLKTTRVKPFAHALIGVAHINNDFGEFDIPGVDDDANDILEDTGLAAAFGGGLDLRVNNRVDIRAFQFDYNPTRFFDRTQHNFRIGAGVAIH
jgi:hypothetical protein